MIRFTPVDSGKSSNQEGEIDTFIQTFIHTYINTCVCMYICVCTYIQVCGCVWVYPPRKCNCGLIILSCLFSWYFTL